MNYQSVDMSATSWLVQVKGRRIFPPPCYCANLLSSRPPVVIQGAIGMSSGIVDSTAYFASFVERIGLPAEAITKLKDAGFNTVAALAYALPPGGEQQEQFDKFTLEYLGADASAGNKALLRRAIHECYALSLAQLKSQVERSDDKPPPRLPPAEREARRAKQKARLGAADIGGFYEPSHKVLERVNEFSELDELKFEPWSFFNHRDSEIRGQKTADTIKVDQGVLRLAKGTEGGAVEADVHDTYLARAAVRRRSLAFDLHGLASYSGLGGSQRILV